jgi:hypothetical protein
MCGYNPRLMAKAEAASAAKKQTGAATKQTGAAAQEPAKKQDSQAQPSSAPRLNLHV